MVSKAVSADRGNTELSDVGSTRDARHAGASGRDSPQDWVWGSGRRSRVLDQPDERAVNGYATHMLRGEPRYLAGPLAPTPPPATLHPTSPLAGRIRRDSGDSGAGCIQSAH